MEVESVPADCRSLTVQVQEALARRSDEAPLIPPEVDASYYESAVLFLLGPHCGSNGREPCLILNKRSPRVKQAGDLCCPGGGVSPRLDACLGKVLGLPAFPLARWSRWRTWRQTRPAETGRLATLFATCLRESFEEMRLNPLGVRFLGPLPYQCLSLFRRVIYPMAGWVARQTRFTPNWEVEKIVHIPLRTLLEPSRYARYRLLTAPDLEGEIVPSQQDFPCFLHENGEESERLWGATYRIVMIFLEIVFGFKPPDPETLPVVRGFLDENYLTGNNH